MVGQRFVTLLENHPWFKLTALAASAAAPARPMRKLSAAAGLMTAHAGSVKDGGSGCFQGGRSCCTGGFYLLCSQHAQKDEIKALEEAYAKAECPVVSNNSAHRFTPDVPMVVPEINADHIEIIPAQRKRLGTKRGFIAVKSNCSLQSYVPALHPLMKDSASTKAAGLHLSGHFRRWQDL